MDNAKRIRRYFDSKLPGIRWRGDKGTAKCPFHNDQRPSLSINVEKGAFFCHGCNASGGLIDFERRLTDCDVKTAKTRIAKLTNRGGGSRLRPRIVKIFSYLNEHGDCVYQQVRFEPKDFRFRRPADNGGWIWNLKGVTTIPYQLPEVLAADHVFIVEGEKDVETLRSWGLVATCNSGGAGKWKSEYSHIFKIKDVVILQDGDEPGKKHAEQVAESVAHFARRVKLLPSFPGAKDVSEWKERGGTKRQLIELVRDTPSFAASATSNVPATESGLVNGIVPVISDWRKDPLDGKWVISMIEAFFADYLVLPNGLPFALSLWIVGTHIFDVFDIFPYVCITSPTKRCGKTRLAEIIELFCKDPLSSVNISEAALFRSIAKDQPTVIVDEAETLANHKSERSQYLLALLQAGFKQGAFVPRCVGSDHDVKKFPVYCPKVVLAIGTLPDTLLDRSLHAVMQRRRADQGVAPFRRRNARERADGPLNTLKVWCESNRDAIQKAYLKQRIDFLQDREADIWEPLFSIASVAVPDRVEELEKIALHMAGEKNKHDIDESIGARLLADVRKIFDESKFKKLDTGQLIFKLKSLPESTWDEDLTPIKLARLLRPFEMSSRQLWIGETNRRGYDLDDFKKIFEAYIPKR